MKLCISADVDLTALAQSLIRLPLPSPEWLILFVNIILAGLFLCRLALPKEHNINILCIITKMIETHYVQLLMMAVFRIC